MTDETRKPAKARRGKRGGSGTRTKAPTADKKRGRGNGGGNPQANFKRYTELAREAASAGDAVQSEYYYQHADHYHRLITQS